MIFQKNKATNLNNFRNHDQLSGVASVNFILALVAIVFLARNGNSTEAIGYLEDAKTLYDFKDGNHNSTTLSLVSSTSPTNNSQMQNRTMRRKRWTPEENMNKTVATQIWDGLQARGCCGLKNETYWEQKYPKSCCAKPIPSDDEIRCEKTGVYQEGCERLINSYELNRMIVLAFVALVNLYLATTSGISAYKTYDYAQANQNVLS